MTELLTIPEVAAELRVSRRTVERLVEAGYLRTIRVSPRRPVVERRELDLYLAALRDRRRLHLS